jgi:hypothetical protein
LNASNIDTTNFEGHLQIRRGLEPHLFFVEINEFGPDDAITHAAMNSIYPCRTQKEQKLFERLPEIFHGRDQAFIPPFPGSIVRYLSKTSAFNRVYGEIHPFLALRDGRPVGRIAAIINRAHNERYGDKTGFFGFFVCENDSGLAEALFSTVAEVLRSRGLESLRGPDNPSIVVPTGSVSIRHVLGLSGTLATTRP